VLDEPNANLDDAGDAALIEAIRELKAHGRTVFIVTHRFNVLALADRVLLLHNGVVHADGPRETVLAASRAPGPATPPGSGLAPVPV